MVVLRDQRKLNETLGPRVFHCHCKTVFIWPPTHSRGLALVRGPGLLCSFQDCQGATKGKRHGRLQGLSSQRSTPLVLLLASSRPAQARARGSGLVHFTPEPATLASQQYHGGSGAFYPNPQPSFLGLSFVRMRPARLWGSSGEAASQQPSNTDSPRNQG